MHGVTSQVTSEAASDIIYYNLISIGDSKSAFVTSSGAFMSSTTGAEAVVVPVEEDATTVAAVEEFSAEF